jgi:ADP-ribose pyrophosphatase
MKVLHETKYACLCEDGGWTFVSRRLPGQQFRDNGKHDAVCIFALNEEGKLVVIKQYRKPMGCDVYELPAGIIDEGETPEQAAVREFKEETGMELNVKRIVSRVSKSAGISDETIVVVGGECTGEPNNKFQEASEDIEIILLGHREKLPEDAVVSTELGMVLLLF